MACPICEATNFTRLDYRARVPILQNRVWPTVEAAKGAPSGVLDMVKCNACGFSWNKAFDESLIKYDPDYDNDQTQSDAFRSHMSSMADRVIARLVSKSANLVEIGCGQAVFIDALAPKLPDDISVFGFDPSWRGEDGDGPRHAKIYRQYFGPDTAHLVPSGAQFIVARHTIEHIPDPLAFLRAIRSVIVNTSGARLFLETPDIDWVVSNLQVQDIFYEHCSIFSRSSFAVALQRAGFDLVSIENVFGGQYFWVEAKPSLQAASLPNTGGHQNGAAEFESQVSSIVSSWRTFVTKSDRPVYLWGAASKGVTFALLLGGGSLAGVVDINLKKIGKFLPITGLRVIPADDLPDGSLVVIMNPNYVNEVAKMTSARRGLSLFVLSGRGAISPVAQL
jgi:Methyltransferase domain